MVHVNYQFPKGKLHSSERNFRWKEIVMKLNAKCKSLREISMTRFAKSDHIPHFEMRVLQSSIFYRNALCNLNQTWVFYGGGVSAVMTWK